MTVSSSPKETHGREEYDRYSMILEWEPQGGVYGVTVPELPGCRTHGATLGEAVVQGQDAIESWVDVAREDDHPVPPPRNFDLDTLYPAERGWTRVEQPDAGNA